MNIKYIGTHAMKYGRSRRWSSTAPKKQQMLAKQFRLQGAVHDQMLAKQMLAKQSDHQVMLITILQPAMLVMQVQARDAPGRPSS